MANDISHRLKQELRDLPENWIAMLETSTENIFKVSLESMKILIQKGLSAIILSASRPCSNLIQIYTENKINSNKIFILCCVCKSQGIPAKDTNNVIHLQNVNALTEISVALTKITEEFKDRKSFLFLDSISTMLIYNDPKSLAKFIHQVLVKIRLSNIGGILISIEEGIDKEIRAELIQLCDTVIKL